jgi:hypothetical protein
MAVESKHLLHDLSRPGEAAIGDDDPTEDVVAQLPANDDPTEDVAAGDGERATPAVQMEVGAYPFQPGATLCGRYRLERVIGRGGFSQVFQGLDLASGATGAGDVRVAVKAPRPEHAGSAASVERLAREYELLHRLVHPGVVRVLDLGTEAGHSFEVMELLEGSSLAARLAQGGSRMPRAEAARVLRACAETLDWVHGQGCVHGDIKPGNIFITASQQTRLLDFGGTPSTAAPADGGLPGESRYATPAYASAQVLSGLPPTRADDLYSFACVAFEVLAGTHPFGRASAVEARDRGLRPPSVEGLDDGAEAALERGLAFEREGRPASAGELVEAVFASGDAPPVTGARSEAPPRRRWRVAAVLVALALLAAVLVLTAWPIRFEQPEVTTARVGATAGEVGSAGPAGQGPGPVATASPAEATSLEETGAPPTAARPVRPLPPIDQDVSFGGERLVVSRKAISAAIPVRRSGEPAGRLEVAWRIVEGSARAGRDFIGPASGVVVLAEGQRVSTLFVPLAAATRARGDATFTVLLEQVRGPARIAGAASTEVILRDFVD